MINEIALNDWYPVAMASELKPGCRLNRVLMEREIQISNDGDKTHAFEGSRVLPLQIRYDHVWTSLGAPARPLFEIPEGEQDGRRLVACGRVHVRCSPLRAVENFLDIAHFPYVHTGILGAEDHPEVERYDVEIDDEKDEVWARQVKFFQPQAAKSAEGGIMADYMYRVPAPTTSILYKTCPARVGEWDIITLFVQPVSETTCDVWPWMALYDDETPFNDLVQFQQTIFMQDRSILENQIPALLPLDPKMETPTRADLTSIAYRRWLKRRRMFYGAQTIAA
ncbi:MAG: aromatic ring-hydroxylating dioxygenase subunit alpha [Rhodobacteraceae bacterium]|nr:aromatic ring-hydroxylating dioxygenase subunit alpha [Paracoccaceae bacterium]